MSQCCGKIPDSDDVDDIKASICDKTAESDIGPIPDHFDCNQLDCVYNAQSERWEYEVKNRQDGVVLESWSSRFSPVPDDTGFDQYHCHLNPDGSHHITLSLGDSENPARQSWDVGTNGEVTSAHYTYIDESEEEHIVDN